MGVGAVPLEHFAVLLSSIVLSFSLLLLHTHQHHPSCPITFTPTFSFLLLQLVHCPHLVPPLPLIPRHGHLIYPNYLRIYPSLILGHSSCIFRQLGRPYKFPIPYDLVIRKPASSSPCSWRARSLYLLSGCFLWFAGQRQDRPYHPNQRYPTHLPISKVTISIGTLSPVPACH